MTSKRRSQKKANAAANSNGWRHAPATAATQAATVADLAAGAPIACIESTLDNCKESLAQVIDAKLGLAVGGGSNDRDSTSESEGWTLAVADNPFELLQDMDAAAADAPLEVVPLPPVLSRQNSKGKQGKQRSAPNSPLGDPQADIVLDAESMDMARILRGTGVRGKKARKIRGSAARDCAADACVPADSTATISPDNATHMPDEGSPNVPMDGTARMPPGDATLTSVKAELPAAVEATHGSCKAASIASVEAESIPVAADIPVSTAQTECAAEAAPLNVECEAARLTVGEVGEQGFAAVGTPPAITESDVTAHAFPRVAAQSEAAAQVTRLMSGALECEGSPPATGAAASTDVAATPAPQDSQSASVEGCGASVAAQRLALATMSSLKKAQQQGAATRRRFWVGLALGAVAVVGTLFVARRAARV